MNTDDLRNEPVYQQLKKDKVMRGAAEKLKNNLEWREIKRFVADFQSVLAEEALYSDNFEVSRRYRHLIRGMQFVAFLPDLVEDIKKLEENEKKTKIEKTRDNLRQKFNPGKWRG